MPDAMLPPSEVKKAAEAILSKPDLFDSEFGYFELGESYSLRRLKCSLELSRSRVMPPIISLIIVALVGVYQGQAFAAIWAGIIASVIVLIIGLFLILAFNYPECG